MDRPTRVLLADGNVNNRRTVTWQLERGGFEVTPAQSGADVLLQVEIETPDIVVIDRDLPDIEGFDVCCQLRKETALHEVPLIVTAEARDRMSQRYLAQMVQFAGGDYFLARPYDIQVLMKLLHSVAPEMETRLGCTRMPSPTRVIWPTTRVASFAYPPF